MKRDTSYDLAGRAVRERVFETLTMGAGAALLVTLERTYTDVPDDRGLVTVREEDARGNATLRFLDAFHREVAVENALGQRVDSGFDATVKRSARDAKGYLTEFEYDAADRLTLEKDCDLGASEPTETLKTAWDDALRLQTVTDRRGIEATTTRDGLGRIEKVTRGVQVTRTRFDAAGNAVRVTDPNGHETEYAFDGGNRRTEETRGFGTAEAALTRFKYDKVGNRVEMKGPRTAVAWDLRESYDDLNRPVRAEDALGHVTTRAFDAVGNKVCEKRPLGGSPLPHDGAAGLTVQELQDPRRGRRSPTPAECSIG